VIAFSGGGDSSALVLALAAAAGRRAPDLLTVVHVVHDLRPTSQALADRDRAGQLALSLGLPFVEANVAVKALPGNAEANARKARYAALCEAARSRGVRFIATAHNSHDQAESVIMALLRGSGPRGLAGIATTRKLSSTLTLIRPMLRVSPSKARALCAASGWVFAHDATNDDPTRLRNAIRAEILPHLLALRPGAEQRIASAAERCKDADSAIARSARSLLRAGLTESGFTWPRPRLRRSAPAILGETLRRAAAAIAGPSVTDRLPSRTLQAAARLICSSDTDPKVLQWSGVRVTVDARTVAVTAR
jgi:tRNA(Ile)-lysidine synthase